MCVLLTAVRTEIGWMKFVVGLPSMALSLLAWL